MVPVSEDLEILLSKNLIFDHSVYSRHLEWIFEKMTESKPQLFFNFLLSALIGVLEWKFQFWVFGFLKNGIK